MGLEIQQTKDTIVDMLSSTGGKKLTIMSNLRHVSQGMAIYECFVGVQLGSKFEAEKMDMLLGLTVGWNARGREGLEEIGKTPDIQGWQKREE